MTKLSTRGAHREVAIRKPSTANDNALELRIGISISGFLDIRDLAAAHLKALERYRDDPDGGKDRAGLHYERLVERRMAEDDPPPLGSAARLIYKLCRLHAHNGIRIKPIIITRNHLGAFRLMENAARHYPWMNDGFGNILFDSGSFTSGMPIDYAAHVKGHNLDFLLGTHPDDIKACSASGEVAAALVRPLKKGEIIELPQHDEPVVFSFDFDRVLAHTPHPDERHLPPDQRTKDSEDYFKELLAKDATDGTHLAIARYNQYMREIKHEIPELTEFAECMKKLCAIRDAAGKMIHNGRLVDRVQIQIVTARGNNASQHVRTTLDILGVRNVPCLLLNGSNKGPFIAAADIHWDDSGLHVAAAPFGALVPTHQPARNPRARRGYGD